MAHFRGLTEDCPEVSRFGSPLLAIGTQYPFRPDLRSLVALVRSDKTDDCPMFFHLGNIARGRRGRSHKPGR